MKSCQQLLLASIIAAAPVSLATGGSQPPAPGFANGVCTQSESVKDRPPDDPHASSFASPGATWYANSNRSLWAWWWGKTSYGSYKVLWVRPAGAELKISGQRLDAGAGPLTAEIPQGYFYSFQASGLTFPSAGCWRVDARASDASLSFIVKIP